MKTEGLDGESVACNVIWIDKEICAGPPLLGVEFLSLWKFRKSQHFLCYFAALQL
jgi:hypothetical protein